MFINRLSVDGYKNLQSVIIEPSEGVNLIIGDNAQGKTNLIESIWLMTGCRSFRGTRERDFVGFDREKAQIDVDFTDSIRRQSISFTAQKPNRELKTSRDRKITLNGVPIPLLSGLFGNLSCVCFTPEDLVIAKGAPDSRRSFIDMSASQLKRSFVWALNKYDNILSQRNALIKDIIAGYGDRSLLGVMNEQCAKTGAYISVVRDTFVRALNRRAAVLYRELSGGEELSVSYKSSIYGSIGGRKDYENELYEIYLSRLGECTKDDIKAGFTTTGVHRDDLEISIDGLPIREFGSQGQQRSAAIAMKIAQSNMLSEENKESPILLLDDVLSELDPKRQSFILENSHGMQVFITACDDGFLKPEMKFFRVSKGMIINN